MRIEDNSHILIKTATAKVRWTLRKAAGVVKQKARANAPVDTGKLKRSIRYDFVGPNRVMIGSRREHSRPVEYSKKHGKPYLRPALRDSMGLIKRLFKINDKGV